MFKRSNAALAFAIFFGAIMVLSIGIVLATPLIQNIPFIFVIIMYIVLILGVILLILAVVSLIKNIIKPDSYNILPEGIKVSTWKNNFFVDRNNMELITFRFRKMTVYRQKGRHGYETTYPEFIIIKLKEEIPENTMGVDAVSRKIYETMSVDYKKIFCMGLVGFDYALLIDTIKKTFKDIPQNEEFANNQAPKAG